jgi:hypothetical protein
MNALINQETSILLKNYLEVFLHPFRTQGELRRLRIEQQSKVVSIADVSQGPINLSITETVSISWLFALFRTFYTMVSIQFGFHLFQFLDTDSNLKTLLLPNIKYSGQRIVVFMVLLEFVFFPLFVYFYIKFSTIVIRFFANLFETDTDEHTIEQTISHSLSSNILLLIPIFGNFLRLLTAIIHLFAGLRNNFGMSRLQAVVVMISPLFMIVGAILLNILYLILVFSFLM